MTKSPVSIFPLFRPQYVSVSEGYLNALAWSLFEPLPQINGKVVGLRFRSDDNKNKNVAMVFTEPSGDKKSMLDAELRRQGLQSAGENSLLGDAVINSILGVKTENGKFHPASPLTLTLALLQNAEGLFGSGNPPPVASIIERIFELGGGHPDGHSAAELWLEAAKHRTAIDPVLASIDSAFEAITFDSPLVRRQKTKQIDLSPWTPALSDSPFSWFRNAWMKLTSEKWVEALPARVWADWATTLLRMAYGLSYLWESAWYESLARTVVSNEAELDVESVIGRMDPVLPWRPKKTGAEIRDVSSKIKFRCQRALEVRQIIDVWHKSAPENSFENLRTEIEAMRADRDLVEKMRFALKPKNQPKLAQHLRESIRYALKTRDSFGSSTDYYGLLKYSGRRYLFVEPGIEWVAVMASLSCDYPGDSTNLGVLAGNLAAAGLEPDMDELVQLLERAGLARGSADADQGVKVEAAY